MHFQNLYHKSGSKNTNLVKQAITEGTYLTKCVTMEYPSFICEEEGQNLRVVY